MNSQKQCHEIDCVISGDDIQTVSIILDEEETVIAEAGALNFMDADIEFKTRMGDGSKASSGVMRKLFSAGKRIMSGEGLFLTHFTNKGVGQKSVTFAAAYPGKIVEFDLDRLGGKLICQKNAFLCAAFGTHVGIYLTKRFGTGIFSGEGFVMQSLEGDGKCYVHAGGYITQKELVGGDELLVDTGCVVAFTPNIKMDIENVGSMKSMIFGNEGLFFTRLSGTGTVWLQSLPLSRLADNIIEVSGIKKGNNRKNKDD